MYKGMQISQQNNTSHRDILFVPFAKNKDACKQHQVHLSLKVG